MSRLLSLSVSLLMMSGPLTAPAPARPRALAAGPVPAGATQTDAPTPLEVDKPLERELAPGVAHAYAVQMEAGQYLHAVVDQRGIDVVVRLFGPDGAQLAEVDSPNGARGPEPVSHIAKAGGLHRIEVRSLDQKAPPGRYEVRIKALRAPTAQDQLEYNAGRLAQALANAVTDAERAALLEQGKEWVSVQLVNALHDQGQLSFAQRSYPKSLAISLLALEIAERVGDKQSIAGSLYNVGYDFFFQRDSTKALEYLLRSVRAWEELGTHKRELAASLSLTGSTYLQTDELANALDYYQRTLTLSRELGDKRYVVGNLNNISQVLIKQGSFNEALENLAKVLALSKEYGNTGGQAMAMRHIGEALRLQGNHGQALDALQEALPLAEAAGEASLAASILLDIGFVHQQLENYPLALEYRQKAMAVAEAARDRGMMGAALSNLAQLYRSQGDHARAAEYFEKELRLREEMRDAVGRVNAMLNLGYAHQLMGAPQPALEYRQKALALSESLGNKALAAQALRNLGNLSRSHSQYAEALDYFQKELKLREVLGDKRAVAAALDSIGAVKRLQGHYAEALDYYRRALQLSEESGHRLGIAAAQSLTSEVQSLQGNAAQALGGYRESLRLYEALRDKPGIANVLHRTGIVQYHQGNFDLALDYFRRALKLRQELGVKGTIADSLNTIGLVHFAWKDYPTAAEHIRKSLELQQQAGSKRGAAIALANLAEIERAQRNHVRAVEYLQRSLKISEYIRDRELLAGGLAGIAELQRLQGQPAEALGLAERAATLAREIGKPQSVWDARLTAAKIYRDLNRDAEARQAFDEAVREVETLRSNIAGDEARASYSARVRETYEQYTDLLMKLHRQRPSEAFDAAALQLSERGRARSLLEALAESGADIRQGVDPALLASERSVQHRLNAAAQRQAQLLGGPHTAEQLAQVKQEITALSAELQDVRTRVRQKSPRYAALTQPVPLNLKEIQRLLDGESLLLEYALGEEKSYLWALTQTELKSFELPGRAEIEKLAQPVYAWLKTRGGAARGSLGVQAEPGAEAAKYPEEAARLSRAILGPAAQLLGTKRLIIVADGVLQYVPFAALPDPAAVRAGRVGQPLVVEHEIVSLPSASVLSVLRRDFAARASAPKAVAVLADPVFEVSDERLAAGRTRAAASTRDAADAPAVPHSVLERAFALGAPGSGGRGGISIPRLPFTRREAAAILAVVPEGEGHQALDFRASRQTATSGELAQYRIVHFATHGLLNAEHPELSGVVLSLVDEGGQLVDGFLRLHEIYNLNLPADLVVLSACQTALGKEIKGEGLVGLTRGFMYAGSPRVVASLWQVDDVATSELMKIFYRGMLKEKLRPAAALRAAQVEMWRQQRWRSPYYWAAFQLQGEWR